MNKRGTCPIQIACVRDNYAALKFLLRKDAKINVEIERDRFALYLHDKRISLYELYEVGDNLLHLCVRSLASACLLTLFAHCQHLIDAKNNGGQTPRDIKPKFWDEVFKDWKDFEAAKATLAADVTDAADVTEAPSKASDQPPAET